MKRVFNSIMVAIALMMVGIVNVTAQDDASVYVLVQRCIPRREPDGMMSLLH